MVDFLTSINKGIEAAEVAAKNKAEIQSVIDNLDSQIKEFSNGKIGISRVTRYVNSALADLGLITNFKKRDTEDILAIKYISYPAEGTDKIAKYEMSSDGYPFHIYFSDYHYICGDKSALEDALQKLVSDPRVGERIYKAINFSPPPAEEAED